MSNQKTELAGSSLTTAFYGSKLFVKIFFWFWMTLIVTGILVAAYGYFYHFEPEKRRLLGMGREMIQDNGQMLVDAYEKFGIDGAANFRLPGSFWLYDSGLKNLFFGIPDKFKKKRNRPPWYHEKYVKLFQEKETEVKAFAEELISGKTVESWQIAGEMLIGCLIVSESNKKYAIISHVPSKMPNHNPYLLDRLIESLPIFLLVTGFLCFSLARYMVKPIIELREASRNFAGGRFSTRITSESLDRFDEIGDLAIDFNDMAEKIENMINSQRRLFGDISHELRSPLARLQVSVELLQKKITTADQPMVARIEKEISRMNALIEEVLQFSKLESGSVNGNAEIIELHPMIKQLCSDASFEGHKRNCQVNLTAAEEVSVNGIPQLIERAVENIMRNALKYSPESSEVTVTLQRRGESAVITIGDRGPGIPESELQKVFTPFYCCQEDRNPQNGGIGLGLAIARRAIGLHQGEITLKNRPDGGLIAEISIPATSRKNPS